MDGSYLAAFEFGRQWDLLDPAHDLARQDHSEQRVGDPAQGNIAQRQKQYGQVADEVDPLNFQAGQMVHAHGQGVVTAGGAAGADRQACANADEQGFRDLYMNCLEDLLLDE